MSREMMGNGKSNIPKPPPPPPLKTASNGRLPKLKTKEGSSSKGQNSSSNQSTNGKNTSQKSKVGSPKSSVRAFSKSQSIPLPPPLKLEQVSKYPVEGYDQETEDDAPAPAKGASYRRQNTEPKAVTKIVRNDVPFFDEELCSDSEDEFNFPCCVQPNSPRYPPNPRRYREWDPSFLPSGTSLDSAVGRKCRRCGKPVYLAELYLSSRGAYHSECYKCCLCGKTLDSWSVAEFKGEVFCKGCYRRNFGTHGCGFGVGAGVLQTP